VKEFFSRQDRFFLTRISAFRQIERQVSTACVSGRSSIQLEIRPLTEAVLTRLSNFEKNSSE
jgi:hypothetical protein